METTTGELTCQEFVELVTEYLEGRLAAEDHRRFEAHLADCTGCTIYLEQMRQTISLLHQLTEEDLPAGSREALLQTFRRWKVEEQGGQWA